MSQYIDSTHNAYYQSGAINMHVKMIKRDCRDSYTLADNQEIVGLMIEAEQKLKQASILAEKIITEKAGY